MPTWSMDLEQRYGKNVWRIIRWIEHTAYLPNEKLFSYVRNQLLKRLVLLRQPRVAQHLHKYILVQTETGWTAQWRWSDTYTSNA